MTDTTVVVIETDGSTTVVDLAPTVEVIDVGSLGDPGPEGPPGSPGIEVGPTPPADTDILWADTTVDGSGFYPGFDVHSYGAVGDGVTDDRVAIQAALDACRIAGGGTVIIPPGTYSVSQADHPANATYKPCLIVGSKTRVQAHGAIIKARTYTAQGWLILNYDISGGTDTDITIEGGTWDGSGGTQTQLGLGVTFMRVTRVTVRNVTVTNCRGTAASGAGETFHLAAALSSQVTFENCDVRGTAGSTASGFSCDQVTTVRISNCRASGMTVGNGFTHNTCNDVVHVGCTAAGNATNGFNSEVSDNVRYVACTSSGNAGGFVINETTSAALISCMATGNGSAGAQFTTNAQGLIVGGKYSTNVYGLGITTPANVVILGHPVLTGNTSTPIALPSGFMTSTAGFIGGPAVPAADVPVVNPYPYQCMVAVSGGTGTIVIKVDGINTQLPSGFVTVPVGGSITLWYSATAPNWFWFI